VIWCEGQEAIQASGGTLAMETYNAATNTLRRLLADLGTTRRPLPRGDGASPEDPTPPRVTDPG
jgi:hypothetical protein